MPRSPTRPLIIALVVAAAVLVVGRRPRPGTSQTDPSSKSTPVPAAPASLPEPSEWSTFRGGTLAAESPAPGEFAAIPASEANEPSPFRRPIGTGSSTDPRGDPSRSHPIAGPKRARPTHSARPSLVVSGEEAPSHGFMTDRAARVRHRRGCSGARCRGPGAGPGALLNCRT
jgi:hypothetical protein